MRSRWLLVLLATQVVVLPLLLAAVPPPQTKGLRTLRLNAFTPTPRPSPLGRGASWRPRAWTSS